MQYELVVVLDPTLEEKQAVEKLTTLLTKEGFAILETNWWGKKTLAYPLRKKTEGVYLSFFLEGTKNPNDLAKQFRLDDSILRTLVLKKEN